MVKKLLLLLTLILMFSLGSQCHNIDTTDYYGSPKSYLDAVTPTNPFDPSYLTKPYRLYIKYDDMTDDKGFIKLSSNSGYLNGIDNIISYSSEKSDTSSLVLGVVRYNGIDYTNGVDSMSFTFSTDDNVCIGVNDRVIPLTDDFKEKLREGNITHIKVYCNSGAKELSYDCKDDYNKVLRYVLGISGNKAYNDDGRNVLFLALFFVFCAAMLLVYTVIHMMRYKNINIFEKYD